MSTTNVMQLMERLSEELGGLQDTTAALAAAMKAAEEGMNAASIAAARRTIFGQGGVADAATGFVMDSRDSNRLLAVIEDAIRQGTSSETVLRHVEQATSPDLHAFARFMVSEYDPAKHGEDVLAIYQSYCARDELLNGQEPEIAKAEEAVGKNRYRYKYYQDAKPDRGDALKAVNYKGALFDVFVTLPDGTIHRPVASVVIDEDTGYIRSFHVEEPAVAAGKKAPSC